MFVSDKFSIFSKSCIFTSSKLYSNSFSSFLTYSLSILLTLSECDFTGFKYFLI